MEGFYRQKGKEKKFLAESGSFHARSLLWGRAVVRQIASLVQTRLVKGHILGRS